MTRVKIAQFKSGLSRYLRSVRQGAEIIVFDRDLPVAKVSPISPRGSGLIVHSAKSSPKSLGRPQGTGRSLKVDIVKLLREDRDAR